jgi:hypothetical protein
MHRADNLTIFMCRLSWHLGASTSWNPQGLSRAVMGLLYLYFTVIIKITHVAIKEFLGIVIKKSLSWKLHIEQITSKLSAAWYASRSVKQHICISHKTLKMVYYSYFHSVIYGGGNSLHSVKIFKIHKNVIIIIMGHRNRDSCRDFPFKKPGQ